MKLRIQVDYMKRSLPLLCTSTAAALTMGPALAQSPDGVPEEGTGRGGVVQEIVVTATRTSEVASRVPMSISAYSQEALDSKGVRDIQDLVRFTPGISVSDASNQVTIRGIQSNAGAATTGIYIDDTPIQVRNLSFNSEDTLPAIFDLERVEVLRGPQGTLFGAGSMGGTVRYITPQPSLTNYSMYARGEIGQVAHGGETYEAGLAVGGPIVDGQLGFRVSAYNRHAGGWIDRVDSWTGMRLQEDVNYRDTTTVNAALAWAPTQSLLITPSIRYQRLVQNDDNNFFSGASDPDRGVFIEKSPEYQRVDDDYLLPSLNVRWDVGNVSLISNTAYYDRNSDTGYDGTLYNLQFWNGLLAGPSCAGVCNTALLPLLTSTGINPAVPQFISQAPSLISQQNFTQELRLQSTGGGRLNWVVGAFYQKAKQGRVSWIDNPRGRELIQAIFNTPYETFYGGPQIMGTLDFYIDMRGKDEQLAWFADATLEVVEGLKLSAGARTASTKYSFTNYSDGPLNGGPTRTSGRAEDEPFTPKFGVTYELNQTNMVYATWAKGFRAGGANGSVPFAPCQGDLANIGLSGPPDTFEHDEVTSLEFGSKSRLADGRVALAASLFTMDWKGIQQQVFLPTCGFQFIGNLGAARSRGFDLQATLLPLDDLTIDLAVGYVESKYSETTRTGPDTILAHEGNTLGGSPWTVAIGAQYGFSLFARPAFVRADIEHKSKNSTLTNDTDPRTTSYNPTAFAPDAATSVALRAGLGFDALTATVFVDNLLDSTPRLGDGPAEDTGHITFRTWRPRTFGVTLTYRY